MCTAEAFPLVNEHFKLLIVDDNEDDALLIMRALRKGGLKPSYTLVRNETELKKELYHNHWDIVISDHNLPGFSSHAAIKLIKTFNPDLPIIVVSGTMLEDIGVEAMNLGAQDYVMKDRLARLIPAVERELRQIESQKARHQAELDLQYLNAYDSLTGLYNRKEFERRVEKALENSKESGQTHITILMDLDQFKLVNDTCGHQAGDELLVQITEILKGHTRAGDVLARVGGDEFALLLENAAQTRAIKLAEQIRREMQRFRFSWDGKPFTISMSFGIVTINGDAESTADILSYADIACYAAKERGRDGIRWYNPNDKELHQRRNEMQWASKIRKALENNSFVLYKQPMLGISLEGKGLHQEFLVRMYDDCRIAAPGEFIPSAERYGLMPHIDRWVIENVFKYLNESRLGQQQEGVFFINLSGNSLSDKAFFDDIRIYQKKYNINPERICFEITETSAIANLTDAVGFIEEIRAIGFKFALDDFGVGLSSFSYLKTIPVDFLKIDGSFVRNMNQNAIDQGIVEACHRVAKAAGLQTIAEFVEDDATLEKLVEIGVDFAQGYGVAKPEPV